MMGSPIYVTRPSLAPLEEYIPYLETIWETGVMTHNGPMVQQLEQELCDCLKVNHVVCVSNGTCALQLAIRALDLTGEVITTPFTFIATANIIAWERCRPVFVDIDPHTWNIDPEKIEERITEKTSAILPVHVFSAPSDIVSIQSIAERYSLKVIYDAAHAMAVEVAGKSIMSFGDVSAVSFHATKLFNSAEGGACITTDGPLAERLRKMRFFGFDSSKDVVDSGMNAKMTELSAGLGLANIKWLDRVKRNRREKFEVYRNLLSEVPFINFQKFNHDEYNYSYMPVLFNDESRLLKVMDRLIVDRIYTRRYFHPSLNRISIFDPQALLPVSERIAQTILCLPLYDSLSCEEIKRISRHIINT